MDMEALKQLYVETLVGASNFTDRIAVGTIATAGSLGILIPPSVVLVLYAMIARQPVLDLWLAGVGPGLLRGGAGERAVVFGDDLDEPLKVLWVEHRYPGFCSRRLILSKRRM